MGYHRGAMGQPMGGRETSPAARKRAQSRRDRQERRWAARSGPVRTISTEDLPETSCLKGDACAAPIDEPPGR